MDIYGDGTPKQRVAKFDEMHGGIENTVHDDTWIYFPDGAVREHSPLGALCPPPSNPRERHQKIVYYHTRLLTRAVHEFDAFKEELKKNPNGWGSAEKHLADLQEYADEVRDCKKDLEAAQAELDKYLPGYVPPEQREEHARNAAATAQAQSKYLSALDAIQI